jgi:hypothetical protein
MGTAGRGGVLGLGDDGGGGPTGSAPRATVPGSGSSDSAVDPEGCRLTNEVVDFGISGTRYPEVREHWERAVHAGRPRVLTINRAGAATRRRILVRDVPTRHGDDRDECPPAMARTTPDADVAYVDATQNRGAGAVQGIKLRKWCSGQRFRVVWY